MATVTAASRRQFIQRAIGLPALAASPWSFQILRRREAGPQVGHGNHVYRFDRKWGEQDPARYPVHHCHEMVQDARGRLILLNTDPKNQVLIYNKDGKVVGNWTLGLPEPHGLTLVGDGSDQTLWITCSASGRVLQTDLRGRIIRELSLPAGVLPAEAKYKPTETAVSENGDIYVADGYGSNLILKYDADGHFRLAFGGKGKADDEFDCCHGIAIDTRDPRAEPSLLITSRSQQAFKRFTPEGQYLETIPLPGLWICRPVIRRQDLYFAVIVTKSWSQYDGMVAVLDANNRVVSLPGGSAPTYADGLLTGAEADGRTFLKPHDVCVDEDDNLYVPQWNSGRTYPVRLLRQ